MIYELLQGIEQLSNNSEGFEEVDLTKVFYWPPKKIRIKIVYDIENPGQVIKTECTDHSYAWSGKMPCTGTYRCIYCGKPEDETTFNGKRR